MPSSNALRLPIVALGLALISGCANQSNDQTKQLHEINERLQRLQSTSDRLEERVSSLESLQRAQSSRTVPIALAPSVPSELPLVKMSPPNQSSGGDSQASETGADGARTLIVGEGTRVEARPSTDNGGSTTPPTRAKASGDKKNNGRTEAGNKTP